MDFNPSKIIIHGVEHPMLDIESWFVADSTAGQNKLEKRLHEAHCDVASMFIDCKPFLFNPIKKIYPERKGEIAEGVFLTHPSEIQELSSAVLLNTPVWEQCLGKMTAIDIMEVIEQLYSDITFASEIFVDWHTEHGFHIFEVVI